MSKILVINCPSGRQCQHLIPLLYKKTPFKLRLNAHSDSSAEKLRTTYPDAEIVQHDLTSLTDCLALLKGASGVYHVGPSFHSRELEIGLNMVDAAVSLHRQDSVFEHFVFSSVLGTQHTRLMQHDLKARVEERLMLSPLNYTILQPTNFMDAYPIRTWRDQEGPISMERLWTPGIGNSVIALRDLAEAAVKILTEGPRHYFAVYPLCSTLPVSDTEVAEKAQRVLGKKIELKSPSFEKGVESVLGILYGGRTNDSGDDFLSPAAGGDARPDIVRDEAERLVLFYRRRGLKGNPNVLAWILGREPTSVEQWIGLQLQ